MFNKKPRRNFRRRKNESSEEDERTEEANAEVQVSASPPPPKQQSRGVSCSSLRHSPKPKTGSDAEEDQQHLHENDTETTVDETIIDTASKNENNRTNLLSFADEKEVDGDGFQVKKLTDRAVVFKARLKQDRNPAAVTQYTGQGSPVPVTACELTEAAGEGSSDGDDGDASSETSASSSSRTTGPDDIPDSRQIQAARKRRQLARTGGDYIPLDTTQRGRAELRGEEEEEVEDSEDEPDDHERRIPFAPKPKSLRQRMAEKMGERGGSDSNSESSYGQEDEDLWEEQQIGKGIKRPQKGVVAPVVGKQVKVKVDPSASLCPVSLDIIKKRLTEKLESLREVHRAHEAEHRRMQLDMESARAALQQLEDTTADQCYRFYKDMKLYVQNLVDCLTDKIVIIDRVEAELHLLLKERAEALWSIRREAVREQASSLQQLTYASKNGSVNGDEENGLSQEKSDGGPGRPGQEQGSAEELHPDREARSNETQSEEQTQLLVRRGQILSKSQEIFEDVQEDFYDVKKILSKFDQWKLRFPDSYYSAYIGLCLPKLLGPLIRHQLIGWNPLKAEGEDFEAYPWYPAVEEFCHGQGYEEPEAADIKTLPSIVEKTILPKIQGFVENVWDSQSSEQTECLVNLCRRLQEDYSVLTSELKKTSQAFVNAVVLRLRSSVDEDVFIPIYPKKFVEDKTSPQYRFLNQQFCSAVKLLGNITLWDGLVPEDTIKELGLDKLLNRYIMMTLMNTLPDGDNVERCKKVAACFPKPWFATVDTRSSIPQLQNFSNHLLQTAHSLSKHSADPRNRDLVVDIVTVLGNIKALDHAAALIEECPYEDLKTSLPISQ
ncbi:intron Large complex component GCFC2 [Amia ocellicauda]|uniref:intron Large complex component GCFC2 n=1 Tax=Amia ocellicauda TaxID=2972642 RepID=UPI003463B26E